MPMRWRWPPEKFEGEAVDGVRREADAVEEGADTVAAFCRGADAVDEVGFGNDLADGHALVEESAGSWKTIWMPGRRGRRRCSERFEMSVP